MSLNLVNWTVFFAGSHKNIMRLGEIVEEVVRIEAVKSANPPYFENNSSLKTSTTKLNKF
jgi:hypothetical protein